MADEKPRVLVVDDDAVNLDVLVQTLGKEFSLVVARNGLRAMELAQASPPDLILMDVLMPPGPDGFEVCRRLHENPVTGGVPVIFLSVMEDPEQKHRGFQEGGVDYITKPFHADEVLARVRTHITIKRLRERLENRNASIRMELDETSRQLGNLMDNLPGLVYRSRCEEGRPLLFASKGCTRLTGYSPGQVVTMGLDRLVHPDDLDRLTQALREALLGSGRFELTYRIITAWNEEKWVSDQGSAAQTPAGPCLEGFICDVTEKQRQERSILEENQSLRKRLQLRQQCDIVGESPRIVAVLDLLAKAAAVDDNVVIYGESGTGKELAARAVHACSARSEGPFVAVNCGAIPEPLFESEMFGYKKGAFTGATSDKKGCLDQADGGTLFLDELGEISLAGQVKLLRAIEHGGFTPVGGSREHRPNVRIIAATNRDLAERVKSGDMRQDFYYRIHVIPIYLPPLRERRTDIPLLVNHFLRAYPSSHPQHLNPDMLKEFMLYDWPGNVRELQNVIYQYLSLGTARLGDKMIGVPRNRESVIAQASEAELRLVDALAAFERDYITNVLCQHQWKRAPTAESLGIDRRTLFRKMKELNIDEARSTEGKSTTFGA